MGYRMKIEFWEQRWDEGSIGFHLLEVNPYLVKYWSQLNLAKGVTVLVPMCGKSLDMMWFVSQGLNVLGVECSQKAIKAFSNEQKLDLQPVQHKRFMAHNSPRLSMLEGDFFYLDKDDLCNVSAVYDRASLVALPEDMRRQYVELLAENLPEHVNILLVTIEYKQSLTSGPPFSVSKDEVERLYKPHFLVENLYQQDVINEQPRFKQKGLDFMIERVFKISR
jgi:thiopurine S-methyltransferase